MVSGTVTTTLTGKWTLPVSDACVYEDVSMCQRGNETLSLSVLIRRDSSIMWDNGVAVVKRRRKRRRRKGREEEDKEEGEEMWGDCLLTSNE